MFALRGHSDNVNCAKFSPDGKFIVSASWDNTIKIWNGMTGNLIRTLEGHTENVNHAAYNCLCRFD